MFRNLASYDFWRNLKWRFDQRYCRGIYPTFEEAESAIPVGRLVGYDNPKTSTLYMTSLDLLKPSDYAVFYWLGPLLVEHRSVFDFGGNLGRLYFPYQKYLQYTPDLRWMICDVPAVVDAGRIVAAERKANHLSFTTDFNHASDFSVFFTSGTLQYVEKELHVLLSALRDKPIHLLINRVPFSRKPTYFTVQDIGASCCPYRISNECEFIQSLKKLCYTLVDSWSCPESSCRVLFHPSRRLDHYKGMYFRRDVTQ